MTALDIGVYGARGVPSTYSGYETFLTTLLPELVERGHSVTAYCRTGEGLDPTPWKGVERRLLPAVEGKSFNTLSHGLISGLASRVARHDVLLVVNVANAAFCALSRWTGQPVVLNVDGQEWLRGKWGDTAKKVFYNSAKVAGRTANALVADCDAMARIYRDEFNAEATVIPYCFPAVEWTPNPSAVTELGVTPGRYALIAGRHNPENNLDVAAELLSKSDLDIEIVVLGKANYDSPVTQRIEAVRANDERVRVIGHVDDRATFLDLLHHAGVYLHGHSVGGMNPSLVEAMWAKTRICALDTDFNAETLEGTGTFFSLTDGDLVDRVRDAFDANATDDQAMRQAAHQRVMDTFSVTAVADAYEQLLQSAAVAKFGADANLVTKWATSR